MIKKKKLWKLFMVDTYVYVSMNPVIFVRFLSIILSQYISKAWKNTKKLNIYVKVNLEKNYWRQIKNNHIKKLQ